MPTEEDRAMAREAMARPDLNMGEPSEESVELTAEAFEEARQPLT